MDKIKLKNVFLRSLCFSLALVIEPAIGHSGGLDSSGCHGGSRPYHCHRAASEMVGNRLRCDLGSRSKECVTNNSSGAQSSSSKRNSNRSHDEVNNNLTENSASAQSYKYDKSKLPKNLSSLQIKQIQRKLKLLGIYEGKTDGVFGSDTALALDIYNISKGLQIGDYSSKSILNSLDIK